MPAAKPLFRYRLQALLIDYLIILAWMAGIGIISLILYLIMDGYPDYLGTLGPFGTQLLFFLLLTLPIGLYLYKTESGPRHATIGKHKAGLKVASIDKNVPTNKQILIRTVIKLLPWEVAHTFVWQMQYVFYKDGYDAPLPTWISIGLGVAIILAAAYISMVALRKDGRGPHDIAAKTQVV